MTTAAKPRNWVAKHARLHRAACHADPRRKVGRAAKHKKPLALDTRSAV